MKQAHHICKNCSNVFQGGFCNICGEKIYTEKDKALKNLFKEAFHFLTHFEGSFFTTVKAVFLKPGLLSFEFCNGIRKKYFKPVTFFLVCIVLYLLFPKFQGLNMKFATYVNREYNYSWYALPVAKQKIASKNLTGNLVSEIYNGRSEKFAKPLLLLLLPFSSLFLWLLHVKRRRLLFDHFILATEITSFNIALNFLIAPFCMWFVTLLVPSAQKFFYDGGPFMFLMWAIGMLQTSIAFRVFYKQAWWMAILKAIAFTAIYVLIIQDLYKMILYLVVMLSI